MATYANDLRLKEIATGDEDGQWGTSTNTNLSLIADAFSLGTKQMAANADETFTMPNATADGTRSLYLKITSAVSLTATRTVTLAPNTVSKVWIIENATTGSQSITIAQGSGSSVTIANGGKVMVVTDGAGAGAAVTNANPTTTSGTVTSVSGTGTVNGITLTGTVTSSGNLTLGGTLSGVDLTSQVTGTLPVANGGTGATTLTGVLKGNGTSAFTAATAGTDFVAPGTATTFTATQTFSGSTSALGIVLSDAAETATVSATAATGTINYDITTQSVLYYTSNASANWTVNFRASSGTSLNTALSTGQSTTVAFLVTQGSTAYYNNVVQVDGTTSGVTTRWIGGAPTAGNASGIDSYRYLIIKTGSATFTVLASVTQFKA